jgi:hypothetical protein
MDMVPIKSFPSIQKYHNDPTYLYIEYAREREIETAHANPSETSRGLSSHMLSIAQFEVIISPNFIHKISATSEASICAGIHRQDQGLLEHRNTSGEEEEEQCSQQRSTMLR